MLLTVTGQQQLTQDLVRHTIRNISSTADHSEQLSQSDESKQKARSLAVEQNLQFYTESTKLYCLVTETQMH